MTRSAAGHNYSVTIDASDIDFMGHVNNAVYLKWVQAAVISHWETFATQEDIALHLWIALKHEITYRKPAFLEDPIVVTTLLEKLHGTRAFYETVVKRGAEVLAEVRSVWCCVNADSFRPVRIKASIIARFT